MSDIDAREASGGQVVRDLWNWGLLGISAGSLEMRVVDVPILIVRGIQPIPSGDSPEVTYAPRNPLTKRLQVRRTHRFQGNWALVSHLSGDLTVLDLMLLLDAMIRTGVRELILAPVALQAGIVTVFAV